MHILYTCEIMHLKIMHMYMHWKILAVTKESLLGGVANKNSLGTRSRPIPPRNSQLLTVKNLLMHIHMYVICV